MSKNETTEKKKATKDPEVLAISRIMRILASLDIAAAERVAEYVANRTNEQAQRFVPDGNG